MQIHGASYLHGPQGVGSPHQSRGAAASQSVAVNSQDELQLSDVGQVLDKVQSLPEMRLDRINQIREQLAAGTYDIDGNLEKAVDRMLDEFA